LTVYTLNITLPVTVPDDVLVEHIGAALKKLIRKPQTKPRTSVEIVAKSVYKLEEDKPFASGGYVTGDHPLVAAVNYGPVFTRAQVEAMGGKAAIERLVATSGDPNATYPSTSVRNHPFEGPELFDDIITEHTPADVMDKVFTAIDQDFPHLAELFDHKRKESAEHNVTRRNDLPEPPAEGDWTLESGEHVGED
jgi:hypothetical protein